MTPEEEAKLAEKYGPDVLHSGLEDFMQYTADRKKALDELNKEKAKQDVNFGQHNSDFHKNKKWPYEKHLKNHNKSWDEKELSIAKKHGFKEPEKDKETLRKEQFEDFKKQFKASGLDKEASGKERFEDFKSQFKASGLDKETVSSTEFEAFKKQFQANEKAAQQTKQGGTQEAKQEQESSKKQDDKKRQEQTRADFLREMKGITEKSQNPEI